MGKILWIDLENKTYHVENLDEQVYREYLGGYGLGVKILMDRMPAGIDPLGPENILGFVPGLLTGSGLMFTGRYTVVCKSPLTGGWADANSGGDFGPELRHTGYDGVFVVGCAQTPTYLVLREGKVLFEDAAELWGKDTIETEEALKNTYGDRVKVASIGPAGEKLCLIAGIVNDRGRIAARSGVGAVMGSKKLKAIVVRGDQPLSKADVKACGEINRTVEEAINGEKAMPGIKLFHQMGTTLGNAMSVANGDSPIKNWGGNAPEDFPMMKARGISDAAIVKHNSSGYGCSACPLACGGITTFKGERHEVKESHRAEYETLAVFGQMICNNDLETIFALNDLCNRWGFDTISAGNTIAWAYECYDKGLITTSDTDGLEIKWGDGEAAILLLRLMVERKGIGDLMADGVKRATLRLGRGSEAYAMHIGGQEPGMHDPRFNKGLALTYLTDPTPGRHTAAGLGEPSNPNDRKKGHTHLVKQHQAVAALGYCLFGTLFTNLPIRNMVKASTGWEVSEEQLLEIGARIQTMRHIFNLREGVNPVTDWRIPDRLLGKPPLAKGPTANVSVEIETPARDLYAELGWDWETGKPTRECLEGLGLKEYAALLYK
jgi:aldehyde:ferredoxin oxidoreductase